MTDRPLARRLKVSVLPLIVVPLAAIAALGAAASWFEVRTAGEVWAANGMVMARALLDQTAKLTAERVHRFVDTPPDGPEALSTEEHLFLQDEDGAISRVLSHEPEVAGDPTLRLLVEHPTSDSPHLAYRGTLYMVGRYVSGKRRGTLLHGITMDDAQYIADHSGTEIAVYGAGQQLISTWDTAAGDMVSPPPLTSYLVDKLATLRDEGSLYLASVTVNVKNYAGFDPKGMEKILAGASDVGAFAVGAPLDPKTGSPGEYLVAYVPHEALLKWPRRILYTSVAIILLFTLASVVLLGQSATRISRPVTEVSTRIAQLSSRIALRITGVGDNAPRAVHGGSEIAALVASCARLEEIYTASETVQAELAKSQSQATNAARMATLGEMAGGIAHEINTPLGVIAMRARHITRLVKTNPERLADISNYAAIIDETVTRIGKVIDGLKSFSRSGESDPMQPTAVKAIVQDTLDLCLSRFENHGITVTVTEIPADLTVDCRGVQISQILLNLLNNAHYAVRDLDGERQVTIEISDLHEKVQIAVTDSGCGVPAQLRERLMQPFFTTKPIGEGTGLGLSISYGIATAHKGRLYLSPDSPRTTFILELPKTQANLSGKAPVLASASRRV